MNSTRPAPVFSRVANHETAWLGVGATLPLLVFSVAYWLSDSFCALVLTVQAKARRHALAPA